MKFLLFSKIAAKQTFANRGAILGLFGFFGVILFVFSTLWKVVAAKEDLGMPPQDMLWYLAMTEWIVLSIPLIHFELEEDVKTGNLSYFLGRPTSYLWTKFFGNWPGSPKLLSHKTG